MEDKYMEDKYMEDNEMEYHQERKNTPIFSGVLMYFPDAINAVAKCSKIGNDQHNPNCPLFWNRAKSGDEKDALVRHLMEAGEYDTDGVRHSTKVAWRALANLQKELELEGEAPLSSENIDQDYSFLEDITVSGMYEFKPNED